MSSAPEKIPIHVIANHLGVRTKRVQEKVHKLNLPVNGDFLSVNHAVQLVETNVHNNKVAENTRDKAKGLLNRLQQGIVNVPNTPARKRQYRRHGTSIDSKDGKVGSLYVQRPSLLHRTIMGTVNATVQLGVQALESTHFKFVALLVAIGVQMQHSASWYERTVPDGQNNMYAAYGYAFMVDLFIIVVTMEGKVNIAKTFAVLTFLANILYFQFWIGFDGSGEAVTNAISSILISGIIAYIIYAYSELFVKYRNVDNLK